MKVTNRTAWSTADLKRILQRAAEQELEPAKRKALHVTVSYTRGHYSSGCASIGGRYCTVRIQHPETRTTRKAKTPDGWVPMASLPADTRLRETVLHFASVAAHEFAHCRGMRHDTMPACYKWSGRWREHVAWAADLPLQAKAPRAKAKPTLDAKLAHIAAQRQRAETRAKRAQTILKKWLRKERYYTRQMAAQKASQS